MSLWTLRIKSQLCYMRNVTDMILYYFHQHFKGLSSPLCVDELMVS